MQQLILKYKNYLIGFALGALAGFLYWRFVGCNSGTCPITSKWFNSTIYGAVVGLLFAGSTKKERKKEEKSNVEST